MRERLVRERKERENRDRANMRRSAEWAANPLDELRNRVYDIEKWLERLEDLSAERESRAIEHRQELETALGALGGDVGRLKGEVGELRAKIETTHTKLDKLIENSEQDVEEREARLEAAKLARIEERKRAQERADRMLKEKREARNETWKFVLMLVAAIAAVIGAWRGGGSPTTPITQPTIPHQLPSPSVTDPADR